MRERNNLEEPGLDGRVIIKWIIKKWVLGVLIGSSWLRIRTGGIKLFHKMREIS
jgi:hypothetical protein